MIDHRNLDDPLSPAAAAQAAPPAEFLIPKKYVIGGLGVVLLGYFTYSGILNRGYESKTISSAGISRTSYGNALGSKRMFLREGQTLVADYDVDIDHGGLFIRLAKLWDVPGTPAVGVVKVSQSGSGQLRVPIPETGVYNLRIHGSASRKGYSLSYTVSWKATNQ